MCDYNEQDAYYHLPVDFFQSPTFGPPAAYYKDNSISSRAQTDMITHLEDIEVVKHEDMTVALALLVGVAIVVFMYR